MSSDEKPKSRPGEAQWPEFDLFGEPVPASKGAKGRPEHVPSKDKATLVMLLASLRKTKGEIASALSINQKTLNKHYFSPGAPFRVDMKQARARIDAALLDQTWRKAAGGSLAAIKTLWDKLDAADRDLSNFDAPEKPKKEPKKGKKEIELEEAATAADDDEDWSGLLDPRDPPAIN